MRVPAIRGVIDRRILVNYRTDPEAIARLLPAPFRPHTVAGHAIAGICLIRLKAIRPKAVPLPCGIGSENAAHRIAVEWDDRGRRRTGVFIPRRDTSSRLNTWAGGRLFPGEHHHARFHVRETDDHLAVRLDSDDGQVRVAIEGSPTDDLPAGSVFDSVAEASAFFEAGALGYSATHEPGRYDGLELRCLRWAVQPMAVQDVASSLFDDPAQFPPGSAVFDCALLMRGIEHEWHSRDDICCPEPAAA